MAMVDTEAIKGTLISKKTSGASINGRDASPELNTMITAAIFIGILIISAILLELSGVPTEMIWIIIVILCFLVWFI